MHVRTPKSFANSSPGLRALARYPGTRGARSKPTLKGLPGIVRFQTRSVANSFRVHSSMGDFRSQGVALGWDLRTPSAYTTSQSSEQYQPRCHNTDAISFNSPNHPPPSLLPFRHPVSPACSATHTQIE